MGRKANLTLDDNTFPNRLRTLMDNHGITQQVLADYLQITRQSVSYYRNGSSSPDWETLVKISNFFSVSTDYLLGRVKNPSPNQDIQGVCRYTGLSEQSVAFLHHEQITEVSLVPQLIDSVLFVSDCPFYDSSHKELLGELLCSGSGVDDSILGVLLDIADAKKRYQQRNYILDDEQKSKVDDAAKILSTNGYLAITPDDAYRHSVEMAVAAFRKLVIRIVEKD